MITHSVFDPIRATPVSGGLGQSVLPGSIHTSSWWKQTMEGLYFTERERNMEEVTNLTLQSPSVFFLCFSCLPARAVVILRVRWQQERPLLLKCGSFCSWQSSRTTMEDWTVTSSQWSGTEQLSPRISAFPKSLQSQRAVQSAELEWWHNCSVGTVGGWNENPADFPLSCVLEAFIYFFAISLGRNLSLVLQTVLPLREWCFSWHISSCPNCW